MIKSVRCFFLRLRESEINFVFCEWMLFYPLATKQYTVLFLPNSHVNLEPRVSCALHNSLPRAKDGKRQKWQGRRVLAIFPISPSATSCTHLSLQGRQKGLFSIIRRSLAALSKSVIYCLFELYPFSKLTKRGCN